MMATVEIMRRNTRINDARALSGNRADIAAIIVKMPRTQIRRRTALCGHFGSK